MGYSFGKRSTKNLNTCEDDIRKVMEMAISVSEVDFGISEGVRTLERQMELFNQGKSKIDGTTRKGKHNHNPSQACDIYIYHPDLETRRRLAYDVGSLCYVAGVIMACTQILLHRKEITHTMRWGGNWDKDGVILKDQSFDDLPHFEIRII